MRLRKVSALVAMTWALAACGGGDETAAAHAVPPGDAADAVTAPAVVAPAPAPTAPRPEPMPAAPVVDRSAVCGSPAAMATLLALVNELRSSAGTCGGTPMPAVSPLAWNDRLASAASRQAADMAAHGVLDHVGSDGSRMVSRVAATGYGYQGVGENVMVGTTSVATAVAAWHGSPPHCMNMLAARYTEVGGACASDPRHGTYWALVLARPWGAAN